MTRTGQAGLGRQVYHHTPDTPCHLPPSLPPSTHFPFPHHSCLPCRHGMGRQDRRRHALACETDRTGRHSAPFHLPAFPALHFRLVETCRAYPTTTTFSAIARPVWVGGSLLCGFVDWVVGWHSGFCPYTYPLPLYPPPYIVHSSFPACPTTTIPLSSFLACLPFSTYLPPPHFPSASNFPLPLPHPLSHAVLFFFHVMFIPSSHVPAHTTYLLAPSASLRQDGDILILPSA